MSLEQTKHKFSAIIAGGPRAIRNLAIIAGLAAGIVHLAYHVMSNDPYPGDFVWALRTAYTLLNGIDPYGFTPDPQLIPYPLPVALFGLPFVPTIGVLPLYFGGAVFVGVSTAVLVWSMLKAGEGWRLASILLSGPYWIAIYISQWSPLIVAAWYIPVLAPLLVIVKPHIALPVAITRKPSTLGLLIAAVVLLVSLIVDVTWPFRFLGMIQTFQNIVPILTLPFGPLLLLAVLRWRDERTRLLLFMAMVPQRTVYDFLPLWLVPRSPRGVIMLTVISWIVVLWGLPTWPMMMENPDIRWAVQLLYLPLLAMALWPRRSVQPVQSAHEQISTAEG